MTVQSVGFNFFCENNERKLYFYRSSCISFNPTSHLSEVYFPLKMERECQESSRPQPVLTCLTLVMETQEQNVMSV